MALDALCSLKPFLRIDLTDKSYDAVLTSLIDIASEYVESYCGRKFALNSYTEFYRGFGVAQLRLRNYPVVSVESVWFDEKGYWGDAPGSFDSTKLLTEGVDYALQRDQPDGSSLSAILLRINDVWRRPYGRAGVLPWGRAPLASLPLPLRGNVKVEYTAGYGAVPGPVLMAVRLVVARLFKSGEFGASLSNFAFEDYSYALAIKDGDDLLGPAKSLLINYKGVVV